MDAIKDYTAAANNPLVVDQLFLRLSLGDECWEWQGWLNKGYGNIVLNGTTYQAHRLVYEALVGPVQPELHLDHLCRNRRCVRPGHLEPVTPEENFRRGAPYRRQAAQCPQGHPYSEENTYVAPSGWIQCRTCRAEQNRRTVERRRREREAMR